MPQYKLTYRADNKEHVYVTFAQNEAEVKNFRPSKVVDDDFNKIAPLDGELIKVEEMQIFAVFQLDARTYATVQAIAQQHGLKAEKAVGSYCLEISGNGDWIKSDWVNGHKRLSSNWVSG